MFCELFLVRVRVGVFKIVFTIFCKSIRIDLFPSVGEVVLDTMVLIVSLILWL